MCVQHADESKKEKSKNVSESRPGMNYLVMWYYLGIVRWSVGPDILLVLIESMGRRSDQRHIFAV